MSISEIVGRYNLSEREQGAVGFVLEGLTNKKIAERMKISPDTVKAILRAVMGKMGASNRLEIVLTALGCENPKKRWPNQIRTPWLRDLIFWSVMLLTAFLLWIVVRHSGS
jgi:DNA-binding CsgD family transcriptional regulator